MSSADTPTTAVAVLADEADRVLDGALRLLEQVGHHQDGESLLNRRPAPEANPVGWLLWHIGRVQDAQVAPLAGTEQVWHSGGFGREFDLDLPDDATGYGQDAAEVDRVVVTPAQLRGYLQACHDELAGYLRGLGADDDPAARLDEVVDTAWDPPVTRGVRLVSIVDDITQHLGQAEYAWGIVTGSDHEGPA